MWKRVPKISSPSSAPLYPTTNLPGPSFIAAYLVGPLFSTTSTRRSYNSNLDSGIRHLKICFAIFSIFEGLWSCRYSNLDSGFAHNFVCCSIVNIESCLLLNGFIVFIDIDMYIEVTYSIVKVELTCVISDLKKLLFHGSDFRNYLSEILMNVDFV